MPRRLTSRCCANAPTLQRKRLQTAFDSNLSLNACDGCSFGHCERDFLDRLLGREQSAPWHLGETTGLDVLMEHAAQLATDWEVFLTSDVDSERPLPPDEGSNPIPAGIVTAVVLYHGSEHRGQICTILGALGYAFLDRELYLPKDWCNDAERRFEAKVPVSF